jgi:phospholipid transport system substrate-binding protein
LETQKEEFILSFKKVLENSYAKKTGNFLGQVNLTITKEELKDNNAKVYCVIKQKEVDINVEYKLRKTGNSWKTYDVIIDGSSLVENYKTQFSKYIKTKKSLVALIDAMKKKAEI